jgi:hypothetical protein
MPSAIHLREAQSHTLDEHINLLRSVFRQSMRDPEARMLALKIVSGSYDYKRDPKTSKNEAVIRAWNKSFRAPPGEVCSPRQDECEIERVWDFMVLNFDDDTFQTLRVTLTSGGGDCDDSSIAFATLLKHIGFHVILRVISVKEDPKAWVHIYPLVGVPKDNPTHWVPLDATVDGYVPGDEWPDIADHRDFRL